MTHKNWAGNYTYSTSKLHYPTSISQVQDFVKTSKTIKVLGSRHSFNSIADSTNSLISLVDMPEFIEIHDNMTATISSGLNYGQVAQYLNQEGYALHNLASLPHISVVGACATGTHGSGVNNGNLATVISGIEFIDGTGELVRLFPADGDIFNGVIVNLGAIGIVTKVTLDIEPSYDVHQDVYLNLPLAELTDNFEDIVSSAYSVSLFTDYQNDNIYQVWLKSRVDEEASYKGQSEFYGARVAQQNYNPVRGVSAENCTEQMRISGAWHDRLPHFKMEFTPSNGNELQSEYFIAREHAVEAIQHLYSLGDIIAPQLLAGEIRCIAGDSLWLSECYQQDSVAFHFTWQPNREAVENITRQIETVLAPFNPRPHWGKIFTMSARDIQSNYEKMDDFRALVEHYDPQAKFRNDFIKQYIF